MRELHITEENREVELAEGYYIRYKYIVAMKRLDEQYVMEKESQIQESKIKNGYQKVLV
jgi:hypothetical protein